MLPLISGLFAGCWISGRLVWGVLPPEEAGGRRFIASGKTIASKASKGTIMAGELLLSIVIQACVLMPGSSRCGANFPGQRNDFPPGADED